MNQNFDGVFSMDLEASLLKLLRKTFVLKNDAFADRFESNHYI